MSGANPTPQAKNKGTYSIGTPIGLMVDWSKSRKADKIKGKVVKRDLKIRKTKSRENNRKKGRKSIKKIN